MKRRLSIICQPNDFTGHGIHACNVIRKLPKLLDVDIVVRPSAEGSIPDDIKPLVKAGDNDARLEIILGPPTIAGTPGRKTIYMTTCESTRPPNLAIHMLNKAEAVIVPSNWCASVFSARGVNRPLHVVPLGFSEAFMLTSHIPYPNFVFAAAGRLNNGFHRKGLQRIIDLFSQAFSKDDAVELRVLHSEGDPAIHTTHPRVLIQSRPMNENQIAGWLAQCHCFVNLATEGFGLWPLQAMAVGRPVMSVQFGGVMDFFSVGLQVSHRLVNAQDGYDGLWAEAEDKAVIKGMHYASKNMHRMREIGLDSHTEVMDFTWDNSIKALAKVIEPLLPAEPLNLTYRDDPLQDVTVCITAFNRPAFLGRAKESAERAGFKVVVAEMTPENDLGCNELWLRAAYAATTKRVIILHDDDVLLPELGQVYREEISPAMDEGWAVTWRASHLHNDGRVTPTDYTSMIPGKHPLPILFRLLHCSQLSLSPIVTVFDRETLIRAVKEAETAITHHLHKGMPLGTEVLAHLRQAQGKKGWLYIDKVLSHYGVHDGSGTVQAEKSGNLAPLIEGYDAVRKYFQNTPKPESYQPRIFFTYSYFNAKGDDIYRQATAIKTWWRILNRRDVINGLIFNSELARTSKDIGCSAEIPYVKDLIQYSCDRAMDEDIIILTNMDVCFTTLAIERIMQRIPKTGFVACPRRDMQPIPEGKLFESVMHCKQDGGYDVFAVTPAWWKAHRDKMPDMFLGREAWDTVLRRIGEELHGQDIYVDDVCYHSAHLSQWQKERKISPSNLHNRKLAFEFFAVRNDHHMMQLLA